MLRLAHPAVWVALVSVFLMGLVAGICIGGGRSGEPARAPTTAAGDRAQGDEAPRDPPAKDMAQELRAKKSRILESMWSKYKDNPLQLERLRSMREEDFVKVSDVLSPEESDVMREIWRELHERALRQ